MEEEGVQEASAGHPGHPDTSQQEAGKRLTEAWAVFFPDKCLPLLQGLLSPQEAANRCPR